MKFKLLPEAPTTAVLIAMDAVVTDMSKYNAIFRATNTNWPNDVPNEQMTAIAIIGSDEIGYSLIQNFKEVCKTSTLEKAAFIRAALAAAQGE